MTPSRHSDRAGGLPAQQLAVFWFRRDLRLEDNHGLWHALKCGLSVLPLFIFDTRILSKLSDKHDKRVQFIHTALAGIQKKLDRTNARLEIRHGDPRRVWEKLLHDFRIKSAYWNHDYEPDARDRDTVVTRLLESRGITLHKFKDQVIFETDEIVKKDGKPYAVFTPYRNAWRKQFQPAMLRPNRSQDFLHHFLKREKRPLPPLERFGFVRTQTRYPGKTIPTHIIKNYHLTRDYPAMRGTTRLGIHLRFGTLSVRQVCRAGFRLNRKWFDELIWREFFTTILYHFPRLVSEPFRSRYSSFPWRDSELDFERWCSGETGFPLVDAGMRELNGSGLMHNRARMIAANFLSKILLIDWRKGERYFASRLLDYELTSNNVNWQWAAGCGSDAAPFFRIFNPEIQRTKFDPHNRYIKKWIPEYGTSRYPAPMVDQSAARTRALSVYQSSKQISR